MHLVERMNVKMAFAESKIFYLGLGHKQNTNENKQNGKVAWKFDYFAFQRQLTILTVPLNLTTRQ